MLVDERDTCRMFTLNKAIGALFVFRKICAISGHLGTKKSSMSARYITNGNFVYIAFPQAPVYLTQSRLLDKIETESSHSGGLNKYCQRNRSVYLAFPKIKDRSDFLGSYISSAIQSQTLYRKSEIWSNFSFAHCLSFSKKNLDNPVQNESKDNFQRGVSIYLETDNDDTAIEETLAGFLKENDFDVSTVALSSDEQLVWKNASQPEEIPVVCVKPVDVASQLNESCVSPIFMLPEISPIFHSVQEAKKVLEKCVDLPEVVEMLEITNKHVCQKAEAQLQDIKCRHPFVVVEGMDATGKTTLTQILEEKLGAARYYTPPPQVQHLRAFFDKLPEIVRRAYYTLGNYIVAEDIIKELQTRPVIMDRFWHSTTAYGIANETSSGDLPRAGHSVYHWPTGLLKPTLVLFLTVSEDVRKQRLCGRGLETTFEEKSLDKDQLFRQRLCDSYRRMLAPACVEIDAGGTVEEVSGLAQKALEQRGIHLDKKA